MSPDANIDPATEKVLATITDEELAGRYPDRTHFISVHNPHQREMATRALASGDPVVLVYPDGRELLVRPEHVGGIAALLLLLAAFFLKRRKRDRDDVVSLTQPASVEARDSRGHPLAA